MKKGDRIEFTFDVNNCPYTAIGTIELIEDEHIIVVNDNKIQRMNIDASQIKKIINSIADKSINRCLDCGCAIAEGNNYCGECLCEDDSE